MNATTYLNQENKRLEAVRNILSLPNLAQELNWITQSVTAILEVPTSLVSIVSADKQNFVAKKGLPVDSTSRDVAFCDHVVRHKDHAMLIVEDALADKRFAQNPLVCEAPKIRAYIGAPIFSEGYCLGTICAIDYLPRSFTSAQIEYLQSVAKHVTQFFVDKIEHKQMQVATQRFEYILDGAGLGSWDWWLADNHVTFDRRWCEMLGLKVEDTPMELSTWDSRVHPKDRDAAYRDIKKYLDGQTPYYENVHRLKHANGQWVWILDRGRISEYDDQGKAIRFTGTHLEITQQKMLEQAIEQEREKTFHHLKLASLGQLTSAIGHEINNPLTVLKGELFLLEKQISKNDSDKNKVNDSIKCMDQMVDRMSEIVKNMRTMAKKDHNLVYVEVNMMDVLEGAMNFMRPILGVHKINMNMNVPSDKNFYVSGVKTILEQVFVNLITNARDALLGQENPQIEINFSKNQHFVEIEVVDNGCGIKPEIRDRIFEPFFTTKTTQGGLGLSLVYTYITEHKGQIRFTYNHPKGCRFIVQLPLLQIKATS